MASFRYRPRRALALAVSFVVATCAPAITSTQSSASAATRDTLEIVWFIGPFNPYDANLGANVYVPAFSPLLTTNDANEITSDLLEGWTTSDDGRQVTLSLKPDLAWSDGAPITSADVVMTLEQYLDPAISAWSVEIGGVTGQEAFVSGHSDSITGIEAPDERTVVISLDQPDPAYLTRLAGTSGFLLVLPEHLLGDVPHDQLLANDFFKTLPVVSGPYKFVTFVDSQYVEFQRNGEWSLGTASFAHLFLRQAAPDVRVAMLETGEVQWIPNVAIPDVERATGIAGVATSTASSAAPYSWYFMNTEALADPRVRQAMLYAVDRKGICEQALHGHCSVSAANVGLVAPEWGIPTNDMIDYSYDPDQARSLLAEAGWNASTSLTLFNLSPQAYRKNALTIAQANLAAVGVTWNIVDTDLSTALDDIEANGATNLQGYTGTFGPLNLDPDNMRPLTSCASRYPVGQNFSQYCDQALDELWTRGRQTLAQDQRAPIYHDAYRRLNQNPQAMYLFLEQNILAFDHRLQGVRAHPVNSKHLWNIGNWTWSE